MSEIDRIADQIERGYRGHAWHGTPLRELLVDVDATTAAAHPVPGVHSIWELTRHIETWLDVVRRRLDKQVDPTEEENWPMTSDPTSEHWQVTIASLDQTHEQLVAAVRRLTDRDLEVQVPGKDYTRYVMLHGVVQHSLYHAGQVALLTRAAAGASR
jgi:uncharacterized damage-inducible protein DinB